MGKFGELLAALMAQFGIEALPRSTINIILKGLAPGDDGPLECVLFYVGSVIVCVCVCSCVRRGLLNADRVLNDGSPCFFLYLSLLCLRLQAWRSGPRVPLPGGVRKTVQSPAEVRNPQRPHVPRRPARQNVGQEQGDHVYSR